ncbi:hypothetical protein BDN72DRAFT_782501, partial [Pluteus cervinus]
MVTLFIQHVLGVGTDHLGIYGQTAAYYGTVEQQGRLTLHLHLLLWIVCNLTFQEIRDKLQDKEGVFQKKLIEYLESTFVGEYSTGTQDEVIERVAQDKKDRPPGSENPYEDPVETLPIPPPEKCSKQCGLCDQCQSYNTWYIYFTTTTDDLISKSNVHKCGCMDNKWGKCRARFPRPIVEKTIVDPETGHIFMRKKEPWINTVTQVLTYLLRCNTDVTSLQSGTATKITVQYATDYITKGVLKTRTMFQTIRNMFQK